MSFQLNTSIVANLSAQNVAHISEQSPSIKEPSRVSMKGGNVPQALASGLPSGGASAGAGAPAVPERDGGSLLLMTDHGGSASGGLPKQSMPISLSGLIGGGGGTGGATAAGGGDGAAAGAGGIAGTAQHDGAQASAQGQDGAAAPSSLADITAMADQAGKSAMDKVNAEVSAMASNNPQSQQAPLINLVRG